jgi:hypothetical protein
MGKQGGGGGVADAHFAETDHLAAVVGELASDRCAARDGRLAVVLAHCRLLDEVVRPEGDLGVDQAVADAEVVRHAGVDDLQLQAVVASEDIDRCAAGEEVLDHLPGHFLRVGRNAGTGGAVIAGEDQQLRLPRVGVSDCCSWPIWCARRSSWPSEPGGLVLPSMRACSAGSGMVGGMEKCIVWRAPAKGSIIPAPRHANLRGMRELIIGGARSGKSALAERRASESGLQVVYLATAQALDGEMSQRIAHHRQRRCADWGLIEEPIDLAGCLAQARGTGRLPAGRLSDPVVVEPALCRRRRAPGRSRRKRFLPALCWRHRRPGRDACRNCPGRSSWSATRLAGASYRWRRCRACLPTSRAG